MKYHVTFTLLLIIVLASHSFAQDSSGSNFSDNLSNDCKDAVSTLISNQDLQSCLPVSLFSLVLNHDNTTSFNSFVDQFCPLPECGQGLESIVQNITETCASDKDNASVTVGVFLILYRPLKKALCLEDENEKYCVLEGPTPLGFYGFGEGPGDEAYEFCTACSKAAGIILFNATNQLDPNVQNTLNVTDNEKKVTDMCGQDFLQGDVPNFIPGKEDVTDGGSWNDGSTSSDGDSDGSDTNPANPTETGDAGGSNNNNNNGSSALSINPTAVLLVMLIDLLVSHNFVLKQPAML